MGGFSAAFLTCPVASPPRDGILRVPARTADHLRDGEIRNRSVQSVTTQRMRFDERANLLQRFRPELTEGPRDPTPPIRRTMIVYLATKAQFQEDILSNRIEERILESFKGVLSRSVGSSELASWRNSLPYMDRVLNDPAIPQNTGVAIEFNIPNTGKSRVHPRKSTTLGKCRSLLAHPIRIRSSAASRSDFLNLTARPILK